ncbi:MAG: bifunctional glycosyltransferase/class I SAM-dependent methyltransferase [Thermodesulfobacteriota bacterium]
MSALSLVIPAYDEASRLPATLATLARALPRVASPAEVIVVDDGSRDDTAAIAERASGALAVRVVRLGRNRGKGVAVAAGVATARHPLVAFTDADSPYDLDSLRPMLAALEAGRCDVAIGSRDLAESEVNRGYGAMRWISGRSLSLLTRLAIRLPFRDSQCGLKAFRTDVARALFAMRTVDGFGFDFELLAAALANGLRVERFPVRLTHDDDSRIELVRDSARMLRDLLHVRRSLRRHAYDFPALESEPTPCPLCRATEFVPRVAHAGFRMVECSACGLWYLNPMPTRAALAALYDHGYFASGDACGGGYADYAAMAEDHRDTFRRRLALVERHVGAGRLLDVGAGYGYLADAAAGRFAERWVVEVSEAAARQVSPAHRVVVGAIESVELPQRYFDVVSLQDCLEHLPEPGAALDKIRRVLRPGGALFAVTPNVRSWLARVQRDNWVSLKFPEHVILYSRDTLRRALEGHGFRVESMSAAGQYARLDFLAARVARGHPRLASILERLARGAGGDARRVYVPSGSIAVVATAQRS